MTITQSRKAPTFFWQGALIVLPVVALAVVCLISLRQDERAAENDARNHAAASAQNLARAVRSSVDEELHRYLTLQNVWMMGVHSASQAFVTVDFPDAKLLTDLDRWQNDYPGLRLSEMALPSGAVLADGRQIDPPEPAAAPQPPKWFVDLSPKQSQLWDSVRDAKSLRQKQSYRQAFLDRNPSAEARRAVEHLMWPPQQAAQNSGAVPSPDRATFDTR